MWRIGHSDHVRFLDTGETLYRRAIESGPFMKRGLQLAGGHGKTLQKPKDVCEPQTDELDVVLGDLVDNVFSGQGDGHGVPPSALSSL